MRDLEHSLPFPAHEAGGVRPEAETPARLARLVRAGAALVMALMLLNLALAVWYLVISGDVTSFLSHQLQIPFLAIIYAGLGVAVVSSQPRNPIGLVFLCVSLSFVLSAWSVAWPLYASLLPISTPPFLIDLAAWLSNFIWLPAQILPLTFVFLLFPDGRYLTPRWRVVGWAAGLSLASLMVALAAHPGPIAEWGTRPNPYGLAGAERALHLLIHAGSALLAVGLIGSIASIVVRYRRSDGPERAQMKWLAYAAVIISILAVAAIPLWLSGSLSGPESLEWSIVFTNFITLGIAVAATIGIVRYGLYDIDRLINRTLVYGIMTGVVLMIFALVVGGVGALIGSRGDWLLTLLATGLVAVGFQPIHARLQQGVNRLLYGRRDEPFEVLASLGQRLEQTLTPGAVYPAIVETVAQALRLPYAAIAVADGAGFRTADAYGSPVADTVTLPLAHQGTVVGQLIVGLRPAESSFAPADERLLRNLAQQAGAAVYGAKLNDDLVRSRQQIVASREEERRRLRRDLHDGLGPSLASLLLEARVLRRMVSSDPAAAEQLADEMQGDIRATIDDIRRIVYELRPPALDDLGLAQAIRVLADKVSRDQGSPPDAPRLHVQVDAPDALPPLPAAVEVAAYRIVQEALTNVVRHANARSARVSLRLDGDLQIEVSDEGAGFSRARDDGLGLKSMRERATELGGICTITSRPMGGTTVRASLPVPGVTP